MKFLCWENGVLQSSLPFKLHTNTNKPCWQTSDALSS